MTVTFIEDQDRARLEVSPLVLETIRQDVELAMASLGMEGWKVVLRVYSAVHDDEDIASCTAQEECKYMVLTFNLATIAPSQLTPIIRHEVAHAFVQPLADVAQALADGSDAQDEWIRKETERVVEQLVQAPIWRTE